MFILFNVLPRLSNMLEQLNFFLNCFMDLDTQRDFAYKHILICFIWQTLLLPNKTVIIL